MSIGKSGRVVVEIEPELKQQLHNALRKEGTNLKAWFLENVDHFLAQKGLNPKKPIIGGKETCHEV